MSADGGYESIGETRSCASNSPLGRLWELDQPSTGCCQLERVKTIFALTARNPSPGQQAHVTVCHSTKARLRRRRW